MDTRGKVAIVTGSATGLGAATAIKLAKRGVNLVINYTKSQKEAAETKKACEAEGVEAILVQANVAEDADCRRMAEEALNKWGRIDILVNNAGVSKFAKHADLDELSAEDFQNIYAVNVIGVYQMIRAVEPAMKKQGFGAVVNVSSIAGVRGIGSSVAYAASKGALNTMTLSLARALAPEIRINAVCPGFIETRWFKEKPVKMFSTPLQRRTVSPARSRKAHLQRTLPTALCFWPPTAHNILPAKPSWWMREHT